MSESVEIDDESNNLSALDHNIKQKGSNAYYYAHSLKLDGPKWDGKEEPRLLKVDPSPKVSIKQTISQFQSYSWVDYDDKKLKIYIDYENSDTVEPSKISLETNKNSVKFEIQQDDNKTIQLYIDDLYEAVQNATFKAKSTQFIITIVKQEEASWTKLKKSN